MRSAVHSVVGHLSRAIRAGSSARGGVTATASLAQIPARADRAARLGCASSALQASSTEVVVTRSGFARFAAITKTIAESLQTSRDRNSAVAKAHHRLCEASVRAMSTCSVALKRLGRCWLHQRVSASSVARNTRLARQRRNTALDAVGQEPTELAVSPSLLSKPNTIAFVIGSLVDAQFVAARTVADSAWITFMGRNESEGCSAIAAIRRLGYYKTIGV